MKFLMLILITMLIIGVSPVIGQEPVVLTGVVLVKIPGGTFSMGSNEEGSKEKPVHTVSVDSFWMMETEVTIVQYVQFLNESKPSEKERKKWIAINGEKSLCWAGFRDGFQEEDNSHCHICYKGGEYKWEWGLQGIMHFAWGDRPVVNVSWYGAKAFCDFYGLRLPTEAEWEYAAGGPNHYNYPWGDDWDKYKCCNWKTQESTEPGTAEGGSYDANGYGLYDMGGNVREWCSDWYGADYYSSSPLIDPQGPDSGEYKVLRGGSWCTNAFRCALRYYDDPGYFCTYYGFRCVED